MLRKILTRCGYVKEDDKNLAALSPYGKSIFAPWEEPRFQEDMYKKIKDNTVVTPDRCYIIDRLSTHCANLEGNFAECGVYKGGTAYLMASAIKKSARDIRLYLFDTFTGMPDTTSVQQDGHQKGDFGDTGLESVRAYLDEFDCITIYPGFIPETLENVKEELFSFVHVDVDIYQTSKDCCEFFYCRVISGGLIVFDDYGFAYYEHAEKRAVDEFFADKPETLISLPTGQCIVIKL